MKKDGKPKAGTKREELSDKKFANRFKKFREIDSDSKNNTEKLSNAGKK